MTKNNSICKDALKIITDSDERENYAYKIYYNDKDTTQELIVRFLSWKGKHSKEVEIIYNSLPRTEIMCFEVVKKKMDCSNDSCNELQIKTRFNSLTSTPAGDKFSLNSELEFDCVNVLRLDFSREEILDGLHKDLKCSECYDDGTTPDITGGRVIVGG